MSSWGVRSEESKARNRVLRSEIYHWYKSKGICPRCGTRYAEPGFAFCKQCKQHMAVLEERRDPGRVKRNTYNVERRARLKADGICVDCGKTKAVEGRTRCGKCEEKMRDSRKRYSILRKIDMEAEEARKRNGTCNT